jgi:large subunit ribosomal protein L28
MAYACSVCGKKAQRGNNVSHAKNRTKREFKPNLQRVRALVNGNAKHIRVCTDCIRSNRIQKAPRPSQVID